ncbi:MAG: Urease accessory protein UreD, partial [Pedosphaera sp.]|nr:Urease accessory protein UreD [Pedosphaera sp.]
MTLAAKPSGHGSFSYFGRRGGDRFFPVSLSTVNAQSARIARGSGHLGIEMASGQSAATSVWASSPLKILVPRPRGQSVWAFLSSFGGGLVAGDETSLTVTLAPRTRCFLGTQASTKVYRNPSGRPCGHRLKAILGAGSALVLAPDPVQAFAGSSYTQRQEFHLEPGSGLVLVDWLSSGRMARGERWAFDFFRSRNDIFFDGERVFVDSFLLKPDEVPLADTPGMGRINCLANMVIIGEPFRDASAQVLQQIATLPVTRRASLLCSASPIAQGALIRLAGEGVEEVGREIHRQLAFL